MGTSCSMRRTNKIRDSSPRADEVDDDATPVDAKVLQRETRMNGHVPRPSHSNNHNHNHLEHQSMRPYIDPGLVIMKRTQTGEAWLSDFVSPKSAPEGAYSALAQAVKKRLSERTACRLGCGGERCKYERSDYWLPKQMAIPGIFSHWITDDILACARPTTRQTELKDLFYEAGIRAIFNLESPGEHDQCGPGNHESGFSYNPSEFMDVGIFVYNFAMEDYGTVEVESLLNIMKVIHFSMKQGKIAVHCHAGLGRTGFVICSYLVYAHRMTAHDSIHWIRAKRPGSVQMTKQIDAVVDFEQFLIPRRIVFTDCAYRTDKLPLDVHLENQQTFIHGRDGKIFTYIPRLLFVCAARLVGLCTGYMMDTILVTINRRGNTKPVLIREDLNAFTEEEKALWLDFAPSFFYEHEHFYHSDFHPAKNLIHWMIMSIHERFLSSEQEKKLAEWQQKLNKTNNGIDEIFDESDPCLISALMWSWLRQLRYPVITREDFHLFSKTDAHDSDKILEELNKYQKGTIELLAKMFAYIRRFATDGQDRLLVCCILHLLTHRSLEETDELKDLTRNNDPLRLYLVSEQANEQDPNQSSALERLVGRAGLTGELFHNLETFFFDVADRFEQR